MTHQEQQISKQLTGAASTNRVLSVVLLAFMLLGGFSVWLMIEGYQTISENAAEGATAARTLKPRLERLEQDYEKMSERLDRRMTNIEQGVTDIQLWVAEQRGRESRHDR